MTRGAKIGWLAFASALLLCVVTVVAGAIYFFHEVAEGTRLSSLGYKNMRNRDYDQAITNLTAATRHILLGKNRYWVYRNRANAENRLKKYDAAIADYGKALGLDPNSADTYEDRGLAYEKQKENKKAIGDFDRALSLDPNLGIAHLHRGTLLYNDGEFEKAQSDFLETCRIWPDSVHALVMLGRCYLSQDDLDPALASFEAALHLNPANHEARERQIEIYRRQGETERAFLYSAQAAFRPAPAARPSVRPGPLGRSTGLSVAPLPSINSHSGLTSSSPADFALLFRQALEAGDAHDYPRAIDSYNAILVLPISTEQASVITSSRGLCYLILGDFKRAEADFDEALKLDPNSADAYARRGFGLTQKGEFEDALKDYEESIRLEPNAYVTLCDRGQAFARLADYKSAFADFERAIELRPADPKAFLDRADASLRQKDFTRATGDALTVLGFAPDSVRAYIDLIKAHAAEGKTDDAKQELTALKALNVKDESEVKNAVAWFRATNPDDRLRNGAEAVVDARRACELTSWKSVAAIDTLAAAEAEVGNFADAIKYQEQALHLPVVPSLRSGMEDRLKGYRQRQPYRATLDD